MKTAATKRIIEKIPQLKEYLQGTPVKNSPELSQTELTFLDLANFFENPDQKEFYLSSIYHHLNDDWLEFALEVIHLFFTKDTYLIKNHTHSIITDGDSYMNQSRFADYLKENGLNYDRSKLGVYVKRGKAPKADIIISGTKYWERLTCERFLEEEFNR